MRVALIVRRFPAPSETFFVQRLEQLLDHEVDAHVLCDESRADDFSFFPKLERLARGRIHRRHRTKPRFVAALLVPFVVVATFLRAPSSTIRYLTTGWSHYGSRVILRLYLDAPLVRLRPDVVHFAFGSLVVGREHLGEMLRCAMVASFQGADINYEALEREPGFYAEAWKLLDGVHFQGQDLKQRAERRGWSSDGRDVVIKPGIDPNLFSPPTVKEASGEFRVLSIGRLHWKKGYEYALQAIRALIDEGVRCRYRIIGDGDEQDALHFAIADLGLEQDVVLLGAQPATKVREELANADVFLHAATSEGFCYAALEAQAMCVPVVASDADGLRENVADNETGFVVPRRDARALADAMTKLAVDRELRARMGAAGRARVIREFPLARETDGFVELYRSAARRRAR